MVQCQETQNHIHPSHLPWMEVGKNSQALIYKAHAHFLGYWSFYQKHTHLAQPKMIMSDYDIPWPFGLFSVCSRIFSPIGIVINYMVLYVLPPELFSVTPGYICLSKIKFQTVVNISISINYYYKVIHATLFLHSLTLLEKIQSFSLHTVITITQVHYTWIVSAAMTLLLHPSLNALI